MATWEQLEARGWDQGNSSGWFSPTITDNTTWTEETTSRPMPDWMKQVFVTIEVDSTEMEEEMAQANCSTEEHVLLDILTEKSVASTHLKEIRKVMKDPNWKTRVWVYLLVQAVTEAGVVAEDLGIEEDDADD